jgi:hypothetical protein
VPIKHENEVIKTSEVVKPEQKAGCDNVEICETWVFLSFTGRKLLTKNLPTVLVYGHYDASHQIPINLDSPI